MRAKRRRNKGARRKKKRERRRKREERGKKEGKKTEKLGKKERRRREKGLGLFFFNLIILMLVCVQNFVNMWNPKNLTKNGTL